jgi:translation elongation factor P/translation initiation factor 5A
MQQDARDLRKGILIRHQGTMCTVVHWNIWKSDRRSRVQMRFKDVLSGRMHEVTAQGDDKYEVLENESLDLTHSYREGDEEVFYSAEGEEYRCSAKAASDALLWKADVYRGLLIDGQLVMVSLPQSVFATVVECDPPVKGQPNLQKEAKLDNGILIKVPLIVAPGDKIRVDPDALEFKERA